MWRRVLAGGVVLTLLGAAWLWWSQWQFIAPPTYTCSLPNPEPCDDAKYGFWYLPGRPTAIEFVSAPEQWATSGDPILRNAQWAAHVERFTQEPILVACYYFSPPDVSCDAPEK